MGQMDAMNEKRSEGSKGSFAEFLAQRLGGRGEAARPLTAVEVPGHTVMEEGVLTRDLGLPRRVVRAAIVDGSLRSVRVGRKVLVLGEWLLDWLRLESAVQRNESGTESGRPCV